MYLSQYELAILRELNAYNGEEGMSQHELSEACDLPKFAAKSSLAALRRYRMIHRDRRYRYTITDYGLRRLAMAEQLRLAS